MPDTARGLTPREVAKRYRISPDRVRGLIHSGELGAIDVSRDRFGKPRFVVLPRHLEEWEARRTVSKPTPKTKRATKKTDKVDYYPD